MKLRLVVHGRRTRVLVTMIGFLLSVGPIMVWGAPELWNDGSKR